MTASGAVDLDALKNLVQWDIESGTHGLVPVGTTGEASTLSKDEHRRVLKLVVDEVAGRIPVIAGCGSNNTMEAIGLHEYAHGIDLCRTSVDAFRCAGSNRLHAK